MRGELARKGAVSIEARLRWLASLLSAVVLVLAGRLWYVQVVRGEQYAVRAESNRLREVPLTAPRGLIYDRAGRPMVGNRKSFTVSFLADGDVGRRAETLRQLAGLLDVDESVLADAWASGYQPGSPEPVRLWRDATPSQVIAVEERKSQLPGVVVEEEPVRNYLLGARAAHILGYVAPIELEELQRFGELGYRGTDLVGRMGIERAYESLLRGADGYRRIEVDALERPRRVLEEHPPVPGADLVLTVDLELQAATEQALERGVARAAEMRRASGVASTAPVAGAAVVLEARTGAVLAMATYPGYDPRQLMPWNRDRVRYLEALQRDPSGPFLNRVTRGVYPPGSTFKVITATAAIAEGKLRPDERIEVDGRGPFGMLDWWFRLGLAGPGKALSLVEAMEWSSNDFFWELGRRVDIDGLARWARRFGLGQSLGIDLYPGDREGLIPDPDWKQRRYASRPISERLWYASETLHIAIGQGFLEVTPLQMAAVYAALATDGVIYRPYLVERVLRPDGTTLWEHRPQVLRVVPAPRGVWRLLREGLARVVSGPHGTARSAFSGFFVPVGGKTGTAEVANQEGAGHAWFVGIAPVDNPEIVVAVVIEHGGGGARAAAPVAREILAYYFGGELAAARR